MFQTTPALCVVLATAFLGLNAADFATAEETTITVEESTPDLDRWFYPFNFTPGFRTNAPVFGVLDPADEFENRHSITIVGWELADVVEPDLGIGRYNITAATVIMQADGANDTIFDGTYDTFDTYLQDTDPDYVADSDLGRPVSLFGTGFRNGVDLTSFQEDSPYGGMEPFARNAYPLAFDNDGNAFDPSDNVRERFDVTPWAVATGSTDAGPLATGDLIPEGTNLRLDINVEHEQIQNYLRDSLNQGRLLLVVNSLYPAEFDGSIGSGEFPTFYTKENALVVAGVANAARLELMVEIIDLIGDLDNDGVIDVNDLLQLLFAWGDCEGACEDCIEDLNDDCAVDVQDLLMLLLNWTA